MIRLINYLKKEIILFGFLLLLVVLAGLYPSKIINYPSFVDWNTIIALTGLLIITTGLKESGYFNVLSGFLLKKFKTESSLSIYFILLSLLLSTFLTNDVSLFIVIPLTLSIHSIVKNDISKLVILEVISVNVGSALTPIGNPQNIFLWHMWDIPFTTFIIEMLPLLIVSLAILLIFAWIIFPAREIKLSKRIINNTTPNKTLFVFSVMVLMVYVIFLEIKWTYLLLVIFIFYLLFYRTILLKTDWLLLFLFVVIFIDFHIISTITIISKSVSILNLHSANNVFLFTALISQLISNVPASVLVSKFSHNWFAITYGVNIGGNGLVIGSLANIIALRLTKSKKIWLDFHKYSIPYFIISGILTYVLFFMP
ncbi:MAG TPA: citrate transporter [Thermoplasmatales archaeon]|nr:citrate transporter [Thermoplasmatales archaeon]